MSLSELYVVIVWNYEESFEISTVVIVVNYEASSEMSKLSSVSAFKSIACHSLFILESELLHPSPILCCSMGIESIKTVLFQSHV